MWQDCQSLPTRTLHPLLHSRLQFHSNSRPLHYRFTSTIWLFITHVGSSTLPTILSVFLLTHRLWAVLVSGRHFSWLHELLSTHALKFRVLAVDCSSMDKKRSCFLLTQGLHCCAISRSLERRCLSVVIHDFHRAESGMFSPVFCGLV